jgi:hypothetical protein
VALQRSGEANLPVICVETRHMRAVLDEIRPDFILSVTNKMRGEHYASGSVARVIIILRYPLGSDALRTTALSKRHPVLIAAL